MGTAQPLGITIQHAWHNKEDYTPDTDHVAVACRWQEVADSHAALAERLAGDTCGQAQAARQVAAHAQVMAYIHSELAVVRTYPNGQELVKIAETLLLGSIPDWEVLKDLQTLVEATGAGESAYGA